MDWSNSLHKGLRKKAAGESERAQNLYNLSPDELRETVVKEMKRALDSIHQIDLAFKGANDVYPENENILQGHQHCLEVQGRIREFLYDIREVHRPGAL